MLLRFWLDKPKALHLAKSRDLDDNQIQRIFFTHSLSAPETPSTIFLNMFLISHGARDGYWQGRHFHHVSNCHLLVSIHESSSTKSDVLSPRSLSSTETEQSNIKNSSVPFVEARQMLKSTNHLCPFDCFFFSLLIYSTSPLQLTADVRDLWLRRSTCLSPEGKNVIWSYL